MSDIDEPAGATADIDEPAGATADIDEPAGATADRDEPAAVLAGIGDAHETSIDRVALRYRLAMAWSGLLVLLALAVLLTGTARLIGEAFGSLLDQDETHRLYMMMIAHGCMVVPTGLLCVLAWRRLVSDIVALRVLAILTPLVLLTSADRIAAYFVDPVTAPASVVVPDADYGWRLRSGVYTDCFMEVTINADGLRGPLVPKEKSADEFRILLLGDSITYGYCAPYETTFAWRLQERLSNRLDGRRVVTINTGVNGWSPWQERMFLEREGLAYQPDLVVQCFCLNDVTYEFHAERPGGRAGIELSTGVVSSLEWSGLYRLYRLARYGASDEDPQARIDRAHWTQQDLANLFKQEPDPVVQDAWARTNEDLAGIFRVCRARGVPVAVVCFPFAVQLDGRQASVRPQQVLGDFCRVQNIPFLDVLGPMQAWRASHQGVLPGLMIDFCHLSDDGHDLVTEVLADFIVDRGLAGAD